MRDAYDYQGSPVSNEHMFELWMPKNEIRSKDCAFPAFDLIFAIRNSWIATNMLTN